MVCRRLQFGQDSGHLEEPVTRFKVREATFRAGGSQAH